MVICLPLPLQVVGMFAGNFTTLVGPQAACAKAPQADAELSKLSFNNLVAHC